MRRDDLMKPDVLSECVLLVSAMATVMAFLTLLAAALR
jgi:hypothetical protein